MNVKGRTKSKPRGRVPRGGEEDVEGEADEDELMEETEEQDVEEAEEKRGAKGGVVGRTVTLQMLLEANILQPGEANMSIEYLGQRFIGDLLSDGKIKSLETDIIFASPSAWASHCKRIINPDKKSGCGWASVKYQGQKLDVYKNKYFKLKARQLEGKEDEEEEPELKPQFCGAPKLPVKHAILGNRHPLQDPRIMVECVPFSSMGKIQPFLVSMTTNAALVLDFHCHLSTSEVVGYLAGHWDVNAHNLAITHAFPCRCRLNDKQAGPMIEEDIWRGMESRRLTLVGWYHSHPTKPPLPTLKDIDAQLDYEIRMKGNSDASYIPCVGIICSPYNEESLSLESAISCYWVVPPPDSRPNEYGKPMTMTYTVIQDQYVSQDAINQMKKCADFYYKEPDFVKFSEKYKESISYLEKLKASLSGKFPREVSDGLVWSCIAEMVTNAGASTSQSSMCISIPSTSKSTGPSVLGPSSLAGPSPLRPLPSLPSLPGPAPLWPAPFLSSADLASALFASAKFQLPLPSSQAPSLVAPLPAKIPRFPPPPPPPPVSS